MQLDLSSFSLSMVPHRLNRNLYYRTLIVNQPSRVDQYHLHATQVTESGQNCDMVPSDFNSQQLNGTWPLPMLESCGVDNDVTLTYTASVIQWLYICRCFIWCLVRRFVAARHGVLILLKASFLQRHALT